MKNPYLQQYIPLTEFLGQALGPDYEVALHDLLAPDRSIIAISNSHVSGRAVGAPLTNVALQLLADQSYRKCNYRLNYRGLSAGNRPLRSSTFFIKDESGRPVGLLCINFDDSRYRDVSEQLLHLCHPDVFLGILPSTYDSRWGNLATESGFPVESFHNTIGAVSADAVNDVLTELGLDAEHLSQEDKMRVVVQLEAQGVFLLKGAVRDVAERLHCSQASVYRYLTRIRNQQD